MTYALSAFFTFLRAVPTPVWVLLALVCLGLGPAAGIVGLCVHATAFLPGLLRKALKMCLRK
ncbi:MAG: hypothetical protein ACLRXQ_07405 [Phascolarctobacterium faecium]